MFALRAIAALGVLIFVGWISFLLVIGFRADWREIERRASLSTEDYCKEIIEEGYRVSSLPAKCLKFVDGI